MKTSAIKKIYVAEHDGKFKIGVSNDVQRRIRALSCGCPAIKLVYQSDYLSNAFEVESMLHSLYKYKNVGGEWFLDINIEEINGIVRDNGNIVDFQRCKMQEYDNFCDSLKMFLPKLFSSPSEVEATDKRDMEEKELSYENDQIQKFTSSIYGADVPNIYSDLIYNILFGKNTEQLSKEYETSKFESFRKYMSKEQNDAIKAYENIVSCMINAYWPFEKIENCLKR